MEKGAQLYEGKAKVLFETDDPNMLIQYYKDDATAFNGVKKGTLTDKGVVNNMISSRIYHILEKVGIETHLVETLGPREQLVHKVEILPVEVVVRNRVAGSLARRLGIEEGTELPRPLVEFYYKNDELDDPMITMDHAEVFGWAKHREIEFLVESAHRINDILIGFFANIDITLVDYKLEFGRLAANPSELVLADEISPDSCRLWDMETGEKLDKDRFRREMGGVMEAYHEVARRMGIDLSAG
uniref:Phosphoribosylaminoimidazole-succinocarboxamide synthase n=1 Tax=Magnetococcus massalia (strain MO-1) TaxID=451514 RepID=A0A1S7LNX1_MAGMO|nr:Phosphoribosylaminoimidazole-succinocarboxamide synthetase (SAICAR synthetase) [Candidatus Magnetococcus massalia]